MPKVRPFPPINFSNLHQKQEQISERYKGLREFHSFFRGLLLGVVLTVPVQLFLKPVSFQQGQIQYGSITVLDGVSPVAYGFAIVVTFAILLASIPLGYRFMRNLDNWEKARLQTHYDHDKLFQETKKPLKELCEDLNLKYMAKGDTLYCREKTASEGGLLGLTSKNQRGVLKLQFDPSVSILHVSFAPENPNSKLLLGEIERHFKEEYADEYEDKDLLA